MLKIFSFILFLSHAFSIQFSAPVSLVKADDNKLVTQLNLEKYCDGNGILTWIEYDPTNSSKKQIIKGALLKNNILGSSKVICDIENLEQANEALMSQFSHIKIHHLTNNTAYLSWALTTLVPRENPLTTNFEHSWINDPIENTTEIPCTIFNGSIDFTKDKQGKFETTTDYNFYLDFNEHQYHYIKEVKKGDLSTLFSTTDDRQQLITELNDTPSNQCLFIIQNEKGATRFIWEKKHVEDNNSKPNYDMYRSIFRDEQGHWSPPENIHIQRSPDNPHDPLLNSSCKAVMDKAGNTYIFGDNDYNYDSQNLPPMLWVWSKNADIKYSEPQFFPLTYELSRFVFSDNRNESAICLFEAWERDSDDEEIKNRKCFVQAAFKPKNKPWQAPITLLKDKCLKTIKVRTLQNGQFLSLIYDRDSFKPSFMIFDPIKNLTTLHPLPSELRNIRELDFAISEKNEGILVWIDTQHQEIKKILFKINDKNSDFSSPF